MDKRLFGRLTESMKQHGEIERGERPPSRSTKRIRPQSSELLKFGPKPKYWRRLSELAHCLTNSTSDGAGRVVLRLEGTQVDLTDVRELGRNLRKFALGGDPKAIFGQLDNGGRPDLGMQKTNYAVEYWRRRAQGYSIDQAVRFAQNHFDGFEAPDRDTILRYARNGGDGRRRVSRELIFQVLEAEGYDLTPLKEELRKRSRRGSGAD